MFCVTINSQKRVWTQISCNWKTKLVTYLYRAHMKTCQASMVNWLRSVVSHRPFDRSNTASDVWPALLGTGRLSCPFPFSHSLCICCICSRPYLICVHPWSCASTRSDRRRHISSRPVTPTTNLKSCWKWDSGGRTSGTRCVRKAGPETYHRW